jgi:hypothetical protein
MLEALIIVISVICRKPQFKPKQSPTKPTMKSKTLAIATAAGAATAPASAVIIHTDLTTPVSVPEQGSLIFFSLSEQWAGTTNQSMGGEAFQLYFYDIYQGKPAIENIGTASAVANSGDFAVNFPEGSLISGSASFNSNLTYINRNGDNNANWAVGTRGYLGLRFDNDGTDNFGWADIEFTSDFALTLYSFAYDSSGAGIEAGAIPEPQTAALLAALAAGSAALLSRRRRAASADA